MSIRSEHDILTSWGLNHAACQLNALLKNDSKIWNTHTHIDKRSHKHVLGEKGFSPDNNVCLIIMTSGQVIIAVTGEARIHELPVSSMKPSPPTPGTKVITSCWCCYVEGEE